MVGDGCHAVEAVVVVVTAITHVSDASPHNAASASACWRNSNPEAAKAGTLSEWKSGPWITTTVPPSWTVAPVLRIRRVRRCACRK